MGNWLISVLQLHLDRLHTHTHTQAKCILDAIVRNISDINMALFTCNFVDTMFYLFLLSLSLVNAAMQSMLIDETKVANFDVKPGAGSQQFTLDLVFKLVFRQNAGRRFALLAKGPSSSSFVQSETVVYLENSLT